MSEPAQRKVRQPRYTQDQVADAMRETKGMLSYTAQKLGMSYRAMYDYIERYPALKDVLEEARSKMLDEVELKAYKKAVLDEDTTMIIFWLKTQGARRGWAERQEITGANGDALTIRIIHDDNE